MLDGIPLIDAHVHAARRSILKVAPRAWVAGFSSAGFDEVYDADGTVNPGLFDAYFAREGADLVLLMSEYSPRVTGVQTIDDLVPIVQGNPERFRLIANLNPHYHHPLGEELERQLALGAVALKIHPVHGGFPPTEASLYPVYSRCQELGLPVVFHSGTSVFPGAINRFADPALVDEVIQEFPDLTVVLAHGGRGWWYEAAAFLALAREKVWIELSGLPPPKLPEYFARPGFDRLAPKCLFGSDWPGVPGVAANARAFVKLDLGDEVLERILFRNALEVYRLELPA